MLDFAPLHIISGYSFLQSGLTMKRISKSIKDRSYFGAGISDINVMFGIPSFVETMSELNKPSIVGMQVEFEGDNLVLYVLTEKGYYNLIQLSLAKEKDILDYDFLKSHSEGLLCIIETVRGTFKYNFSRFDINQTEFTKYLYRISAPYKDNFYLGLEVTSKEEVGFANKIRHFAKEYEYSLVAFPRIKYQESKDAIVLKIVDAIEKNEKIVEKIASGQEYFMPVENYEKIYTKEELANTVAIIKKSSFNINEKRGKMLKFLSIGSEEKLKELCFENLAKKNLQDNATYVERLNYELDVISSMGYTDYFLLVQDYISYAKDNGILVGPGRGSSAGSLVSYLLNIVETDPLEYDLQFERFLNPNRKTMPDIDADFMDIRRDEIVQYMRDKYGQNKVANIIAFQTIKAKQALRDIGRIYNYPERHTVLISKALTDPKLTLVQSYYMLPEFKKLIDSDKYYQEYLSLASKIEGLPRQDGLHAAGIILNDEPLENSTPIIQDFDGNYITQYEAKYLEGQGFLKMDFLGIRNLTTVDYCLKLLKANKNIDFKFEDIPFNDPDIFSLISTGNTMGLFQIETATMKKGIKVIKPSTFDDVVALLALNRPGPMEYIPNYANRRDGKEKITYPSEDLKDILAPTYGIIIYQEQINKIATKFAGFTPGEADMFRRAISKKDKNILAELKVTFFEGAKKLGHEQKVIENVFNTIYKFANYGFNKSHSVVYSVLACRMAYLKAKYPLEFYTAIFETSSSTSDIKFIDYLDELKLRGISVASPSINRSTDRFVIRDEELIFPLSSISYVSRELTNNIVLERQSGTFTSFFDFIKRMFFYRIERVQIEKLIDAGAFDEIEKSRETLRKNIDSAINYAMQFYNSDGSKLSMLFELKPPLLNKQVDDPLENLEKEYDAIKVMLSGHPLSFKKELLESHNVTPISELEEGSVYTIAGIILTKKIIQTKKGSRMAYVKVLDQTGGVEITIFPKLFDTCFSILEKNKAIIATGRKDGKEDSAFIADSITLLEE